MTSKCLYEESIDRMRDEGNSRWWFKGKGRWRIKKETDKNGGMNMSKKMQRFSLQNFAKLSKKRTTWEWQRGFNYERQRRTQGEQSHRWRQKLNLGLEGDLGRFVLLLYTFESLFAQDYARSMYMGRDMYPLSLSLSLVQPPSGLNQDSLIWRVFFLRRIIIVPVFQFSLGFRSLLVSSTFMLYLHPRLTGLEPLMLLFFSLYPHFSLLVFERTFLSKKRIPFYRMNILVPLFL